MLIFSVLFCNINNLAVGNAYILNETSEPFLSYISHLISIHINRYKHRYECCMPSTYNSFSTSNQFNQVMHMHSYSQTDTNTLNPVISPKLSVVKFYLIFIGSIMISLHLTNTKRGFVEQKYFTGRMPLLTTNHSFMTCGGPEAFTTTTIF